MSDHRVNQGPGEKGLDTHLLRLDPEGRLAFPDQVRRRWGLEAGADVVVRQTPQGLMLLPADPPLAKVYVEPTSACNLNCRSCMRHSWNEPTGTIRWSLPAAYRIAASCAILPHHGLLGHG